MKFLLTVLPFLCLTGASRIPVWASNGIQSRQAININSNDLQNGDCRDITFIFARGSTEPGNMGTICGPQTCDDLQKQLGEDKVACQGIGGAYLATISDNFLPQNTSPAAISAANDMFQLANTKCPNSTILAAGYSQGTAVMDASIQAQSQEIQAKIKGVVLFGYTRNAQDKGQIPGYPPVQTKVICAPGDLVCDDTLVVTAAHLTYGANAGEAAQFLALQV